MNVAVRSANRRICVGSRSEPRLLRQSLVIIAPWSQCGNETESAKNRVWRYRAVGNTAAFSVDQSVFLSAGDQAGMERLVQYMMRCPFSLSRLVKVSGTGQVVYQAEKRACRAFPDPKGDGTVAGVKRNFQILPPLDFLAEFTQHIPPKGSHLIRYYGCYSNKSRGILEAADTLVRNPQRSLFYGVHLDDYLAEADAVCESCFLDHRLTAVAMIPVRQLPLRESQEPIVLAPAGQRC